MPVIILDTGIVYDLVASKTLATAALTAWGAPSGDVWIPGAVFEELRYRIRVPHSSIPKELPRKAVGLIQSAQSGFRVVDDLTYEEWEQLTNLQMALGDPGRHAGESEAVVLAARRAPTALLLTDDRSSLQELAAYFARATGGRTLQYMCNADLLASLQRRGLLNDTQVATATKELRKKGRELV